MKRRVVHVLTSSFLIIILMINSCTIHATDYSKYSSKSCNWGLGKNKKHKTPQGSYPYAKFDLKKYDANYVGDTSKKVVYLSFDCGYENGNTNEILDVLKEYDIKAIFFVTKAFVDSESKLIKRMKKEGHLVGNHTANHIAIGKSSISKIRREVKLVETLMKKKTGYEMDCYFRPPEGNYSARSLKVIQDLGYRTILWSNAWVDWDVNHQPSTQYVVNQMKTYCHNGMISLMHNTSSADTKALPTVIKELRKDGYSFKRLDDIYKKKPKLSIKICSFVYTGKNPKIEIKTNSEGKKHITFLNRNKKVIKSPVDAGTYYVEVMIESTDLYKEIVKRFKFNIKKATPKLNVKLDAVIHEGHTYEPLIQSNYNISNIHHSYYNLDGVKIEKPTKCGSYYFIASSSESKNFRQSKSKKCYFEIIPCDCGIN